MPISPSFPASSIPNLDITNDTPIPLQSYSSLANTYSPTRTRLSQQRFRSPSIQSPNLLPSQPPSPIHIIAPNITDQLRQYPTKLPTHLNNSTPAMNVLKDFQEWLNNVEFQSIRDISTLSKGFDEAKTILDHFNKPKPTLTIREYTKAINTIMSILLIYQPISLSLQSLPPSTTQSAPPNLPPLAHMIQTIPIPPPLLSKVSTIHSSLGKTAAPLMYEIGLKLTQLFKETFQLITIDTAPTKITLYIILFTAYRFSNYPLIRRALISPFQTKIMKKVQQNHPVLSHVYRFTYESLVVLDGITLEAFSIINDLCMSDLDRNSSTSKNINTDAKAHFLRILTSYLTSGHLTPLAFDPKCVLDEEIKQVLEVRTPSLKLSARGPNVAQIRQILSILLNDRHEAIRDQARGVAAKLLYILLALPQTLKAHGSQGEIALLKAGVKDNNQWDKLTKDYELIKTAMASKRLGSGNQSGLNTPPSSKSDPPPSFESIGVNSSTYMYNLDECKGLAFTITQLSTQFNTLALRDQPTTTTAVSQLGLKLPTQPSLAPFAPPQHLFNTLDCLASEDGSFQDQTTVSSTHHHHHHHHHHNHGLHHSHHFDQSSDDDESFNSSFMSGLPNLPLPTVLPTPTDYQSSYDFFAWPQDLTTVHPTFHNHHSDSTEQALPLLPSLPQPNFAKYNSKGPATSIHHHHHQQHDPDFPDHLHLSASSDNGLNFPFSPILPRHPSASHSQSQSPNLLSSSHHFPHSTDDSFDFNDSLPSFTSALPVPIHHNHHAAGPRPNPAHHNNNPHRLPHPHLPLSTAAPAQQAQPAEQPLEVKPPTKKNRLSLNKPTSVQNLESSSNAHTSGLQRTLVTTSKPSLKLTHQPEQPQQSSQLAENKPQRLQITKSDAKPLRITTGQAAKSITPTSAATKPSTGPRTTISKQSTGTATTVATKVVKPASKSAIQSQIPTKSNTTTTKAPIKAPQPAHPTTPPKQHPLAVIKSMRAQVLASPLSPRKQGKTVDEVLSRYGHDTAQVRSLVNSVRPLQVCPPASTTKPIVRPNLKVVDQDRPQLKQSQQQQQQQHPAQSQSKGMVTKMESKSAHYLITPRAGDANSKFRAGFSSKADPSEHNSVQQALKGGIRDVVGHTKSGQYVLDPPMGKLAESKQNTTLNSSLDDRFMQYFQQEKAFEQEMKIQQVQRGFLDEYTQYIDDFSKSHQQLAEIKDNLQQWTTPSLVSQYTRWCEFMIHKVLHKSPEMMYFSKEVTHLRKFVSFFTLLSQCFQEELFKLYTNGKILTGFQQNATARQHLPTQPSSPPKHRETLHTLLHCLEQIIDILFFPDLSQLELLIDQDVSQQTFDSNFTPFYILNRQGSSHSNTGNETHNATLAGINMQYSSLLGHDDASTILPRTLGSSYNTSVNGVDKEHELIMAKKQIKEDCIVVLFYIQLDFVKYILPSLLYHYDDISVTTHELVDKIVQKLINCAKKFSNFSAFPQQGVGSAALGFAHGNSGLIPTTPSKLTNTHVLPTVFNTLIHFILVHPLPTIPDTNHQPIYTMCLSLTAHLNPLIQTLKFIIHQCPHDVFSVLLSLAASPTINTSSLNTSSVQVYQNGTKNPLPYTTLPVFVYKLGLLLTHIQAYTATVKSQLTNIVNNTHTHGFDIFDDHAVFHTDNAAQAIILLDGLWAEFQRILIDFFHQVDHRHHSQLQNIIHPGAGHENRAGTMAGQPDNSILRDDSIKKAFPLNLITATPLNNLRSTITDGNKGLAYRLGLDCEPNGSGKTRGGHALDEPSAVPNSHFSKYINMSKNPNSASAPTTNDYSAAQRNQPLHSNPALLAVDPDESLAFLSPHKQPKPHNHHPSNHASTHPTQQQAQHHHHHHHHHQPQSQPSNKLPLTNHHQPNNGVVYSSFGNNIAPHFDDLIFSPIKSLEPGKAHQSALKGNQSFAPITPFQPSKAHGNAQPHYNDTLHHTPHHFNPHSQTALPPSSQPTAYAPPPTAPSKPIPKLSLKTKDSFDKVKNALFTMVPFIPLHPSIITPEDVPGVLSQLNEIDDWIVDNAIMNNDKVPLSTRQTLASFLLTTFTDPQLPPGSKASEASNGSKNPNTNRHTVDEYPPQVVDKIEKCIDSLFKHTPLPLTQLVRLSLATIPKCEEYLELMSIPNRADSFTGSEHTEEALKSLQDECLNKLHQHNEAENKPLFDPLSPSLSFYHTDPTFHKARESLIFYTSSPSSAPRLPVRFHSLFNTLVHSTVHNRPLNGGTDILHPKSHRDGKQANTASAPAMAAAREQVQDKLQQDLIPFLQLLSYHTIEPTSNDKDKTNPHHRQYSSIAQTSKDIINWVDPNLIPQSHYPAEIQPSSRFAMNSSQPDIHHPHSHTNPQPTQLPNQHPIYPTDDNHYHTSTPNSYSMTVDPLAFANMGKHHHHQHHQHQPEPTAAQSMPESKGYVGGPASPFTKAPQQAKPTGSKEAAHAAPFSKQSSVPPFSLSKPQAAPQPEAYRQPSKYAEVITPMVRPNMTSIQSQNDKVFKPFQNSPFDDLAEDNEPSQFTHPPTSQSFWLHANSAPLRQGAQTTNSKLNPTSSLSTAPRVAIQGKTTQPHATASSLGASASSKPAISKPLLSKPVSTAPVKTTTTLPMTNSSKPSTSMSKPALPKAASSQTALNPVKPSTLNTTASTNRRCVGGPKAHEKTFNQLPLGPIDDPKAPGYKGQSIADRVNLRAPFETKPTMNEKHVFIGLDGRVGR